MCICYRLDLPCLLWKYISDHFIIMLWHLPWVVQNNWIPESPYDISTAQVECQWLKDGLLNILTVVWIMYYIWTAFFFSIFTFLHWVMLLSSVNYNERAVKPSVPCSVILHRDTWYMVSLYTWVQLQDNFSNHQASLFLLGLSLCIFNCVYVWDIQHVRLGICVTGCMCLYSVIIMQWDVVRQQWLGGTAEWSYFLSRTHSLLWNRLAPRLRISPFCWPQTQGQKWGMGMSTFCCQALLPVKVQAWFISMLLNPLWLSFFSWDTSLAIIWAGCHDSSHSLSLKDAVYW